MAVGWLASGRLRFAAVTTVVLWLSVAGCGGASADGPELPPPFTPRPTSPAPPSPTPTLDPLEAEVLATVDGWLQGYVAALTGPDPTVEGLSDFATSTEVDFHSRRVAADIRKNVGFEGVVTIEWSRVDDDGIVLEEETDRGRAVVEACLDGARFQRVELDSGEPLPLGDDSQPQRHWVWVHVWHLPDMGWRVEEAPYLPGWMMREVGVQEWEEQQQC